MFKSNADSRDEIHVDASTEEAVPICGTGPIFQPIIISAWRTHATHARSLINLTQVRAGEVLLDRFAGSCGILIEACLIGIQGRGIEVQNRLVNGPLCNLLCLD